MCSCSERKTIVSYIECTHYPANRENERFSPKANNAYTAACYCRLSRDEENDGTSASIETQRKVLENYCRSGDDYEVFSLELRLLSL